MSVSDCDCHCDQLFDFYSKFGSVPMVIYFYRWSVVIHNIMGKPDIVTC